MSNLSDNVTGAWINATRHFGHTPDRIPVTLFVEGDNDIPYWTKAVAPYQTKYKISVKTNQAAAQNEGKGKTFLLTMSGLCKNKVVAVDADFDLLIDDYSDYTEQVRNGEFVVNTTYYSLENILLKKTAYMDLLRTFSISAYPWFVNHLAEIELQEETQPKVTFGKMLNDCKVQKCAGRNDFTEFNQLCSALVGDADEGKAAIKSKYMSRLDTMNYPMEEVWLLMRGHNLWDTVVKPVETKRIKDYVSNIVHEKKSQGENIEKTEVMNSLGIFTSIDDFVEDQFYENVADAPIPELTKSKLDELFC